MRSENMFSPVVLELKLGIENLDLKKVELELLKELKQNFEFKETEIIKNRLLLKDGNVLMKCLFENETAVFALLLNKDYSNIVKVLLDILNSVLSPKEVRLMQTELIGFATINRVADILNLNIQETISDLEIQVTLERNNDLELVLKIYADNSNSSEVVIGQMNGNLIFNDAKTILDIIDKNISQITNKISEYLTPQSNNVSFIKLRGEGSEVSDDE
jgi:archaellum component FlaF (FlaF/FlaG flagellin family)